MKRRILVALCAIGLRSVVVVGRAGAATQTTSPVTTFRRRGRRYSALTRSNSGRSSWLQTTRLQSSMHTAGWGSRAGRR
jgi:hypothetical protein